MAQLVGALAVVLSLVYVASEFRQSQALSSSQLEEYLYGRVLEMNRLVIENPDLASIRARARSSSDLSPSDSVRFLAFEHIYYDSWERAYDGYTDGILEPRAWAEWDEWFAAEARSRPRFGWTDNRRNFTGDFAAYVDRMLVDSPGG